MAANSYFTSDKEQQIMSDLNILNLLQAASSQNKQQLQMFTSSAQNIASQETYTQQETCTQQEDINPCDEVEEEERQLSSSTPITKCSSNENELQAILIEEVRKYPCIWDITSKAHKEKPKKVEAWRRISASMQQPGKV